MLFFNNKELTELMQEEFRSIYIDSNLINNSTVVKIIKFNTWFNNNIATIIVKINSNNHYYVFLGLIDNKKLYLYPTNPYDSKWGNYQRLEHFSLENALQESNWLQKQLQTNSNPISLVHPLCDLDSYFHDIVCEPYVKIEILREPDASTSISNNELNNIINKLQIGDIVAFKCNKVFLDYYHFEIYIGNGRTIGMSASNKGVRLSSIEENIKDKLFTGKIVKIHPIIPFKRIEEIIKHALTNENYLWENDYDLYNRNCQHFANSVVLGINYSEEILFKRAEFIFWITNFSFGLLLFFSLKIINVFSVFFYSTSILFFGSSLLIIWIINLSFLNNSDCLDNYLIIDRSKLIKIIKNNEIFRSSIGKMNLINELWKTNLLLEKFPDNEFNYREKIKDIANQYKNIYENYTLF